MHAAGMNAARRIFFVIATLLALVPGIALAARPSPDIDALIARVEQARGVVFIRNGSEHSSAEAAAHLRRKLRAARGRIVTAEQLIDRLGTRSSWSGIAYRVRFADGRQLDSATWLRGLLREIRAGRVSTPRPSAAVAPSPSRAGR